MKIAVLLTGQLRTIAYTKQILLGTFSHADFFLSIDKDNSQQNMDLNSQCTTTDQDVEAAINFFKPKAVFLGEGLIEPYKHIMQYSFSLVRRHRKLENALTYENYLEGEVFQPQKCLIPKVIRRSSYKKIFEQYYYVKQAFNVMQQYELEQGFQYDAVVRLRFDQLIYSPRTIEILYSRMDYNPINIAFANDPSLAIDIDLSGILESELVVFGHNHNHNYYVVNDQHFIARRKTALVIGRFYDEMSEIFQEAISESKFPTCYSQVEYFFCKYLVRHGVRLIKSDALGYGGMFIRSRRN